MVGRQINKIKVTMGINEHDGSNIIFAVQQLKEVYAVQYIKIKLQGMCGTVRF